MRILTVLVLVGYAASAVGQQPVDRRRAPSLQQAIAAVRRATVTISATGPDSGRQGSAFLVTPDGVVATAAHVVHGATAAKVRLPSGETFDVQGVIVMDEARDYALLRIAGFGLPTVSLGNSDSVTVGTHLLALGAPLGFEATVSDGLLSATRLKGGTRLFQISIPISPGSSGGPVATDDGAVIGIVVATWKEEGAQNLNFALPINYLRGQIPLASGKTPTPFAQMSYQATAAVSEAASAGAGTVAAAPARVNDSLNIDWKILDGVQLRSERKREGGQRLTSLAEYSVSRTPQGEPTLERVTTDKAWQTGDIFSGRKGGTWYEDKSRTVLNLGGSGRIEFYWRRTPASNQVPAGAITITADGGVVTLDSGSTHRTGATPRGALPIALFGAAVASLPDSLPSSVYIWFLNPSTSPIRAEPVRIDFASPNRVRIPLARPGTHCSMDDEEENTEDVTVDVLQMTATVGADRLTSPVLAQRPHVRLEDAKCVRLPTLERQQK